VLILTKPIGTGVILAAEMAAMRVPDALLGDIWAACMVGMEISLGPAARLIGPVAHAMTDVTGFGLAGHLAEMLAASDPATAEIKLDSIPLYAGAEILAGLGRQSSLAPANRAAVADMVTAPKTPRGSLLFDPQTCGGLLAAVPEALAKTLLADLRKEGLPAAVIGHISNGARRIIAM
jgi:selenide, water dikinase